MHEESDKEKISRQETLFKPASWQTKIDFINHLVLFNNVLIAILAEKEGGKTSFVRFLQENLDSQIKYSLISAQAPCDQNSLIQNIADSFHLKYEANTPLTMHSLIKQINERKAFVLLVIDNAQNLPEAWVKNVLEEIQNQKEQAYFHLCLISDFSVVAAYNNLAREDVKNTIHSIELGALNENETKTYALHKALMINKVLSEEQLNHLYKMTGGCMAKINAHLASHSITPGTKNYRSWIQPSAIAASLAFLAAGIAWLTWTNDSNVKSLETAIVEYKPLPILVSTMPNWQEGRRELAYQELPKQQVLAMLDENDLRDENAILDDAIVVIPTINIPKAVNVSEKNEPSFIHPLTKKTPAISSEGKHRGYTIQLLASHHISDVHKFIQQYELKGKCAIRQVTRENDSWYILTIGEYATSEQANIAVHDLSIKFSKVKPWVRLTANLKLIG